MGTSEHTHDYLIISDDKSTDTSPTAAMLVRIDRVLTSEHKSPSADRYESVSGTGELEDVQTESVGSVLNLRIQKIVPTYSWTLQ